MIHQAVDAARTTEQRFSMSYDEFQTCAEEGIHAEWVDGEVVVFMPPKTIHQHIVGFLYNLLSLYVSFFDLGTVLMAPFEMRARPDGPAREPDLLFIAREHLDRLTTERLNGPADLIVEVVSDSSVARDRVDKFYEYQAIAVREYWIIDPRPGKERVDCYALTTQGRFQAIIPDEHGRYHATVLPRFWFRPDWFQQETFPNPVTILAEICGRAPAEIAALRATFRGEQ